MHNIAPPEDIVVYLTDHQIEVETEGIIFAGTPIAMSVDHTQTLLSNTLDSVKSFLEILTHPAMPKHDAFHFLQQSANVRCIHLARCLRPDFISPFAFSFDDLIMGTLQTIISKELTKPRNANADFPSAKVVWGFVHLER